MAINKAQIQDNAEFVLSRPSARIAVTLKRNKGSVSLTTNDNLIARCYSSRVGLWTAAFMAESLGVDLPDVGKAIYIQVSSGVLWRAVGISNLDLKIKESRTILKRYLEEAETQRASGSGYSSD
jgi:hypothetical protein